ncbi:hypothetical protein GCM10008917_14710 [Paraclostridium tenue]|uniref:Uncharacterized protein n=1 Tax=Paraclostridium tenue TaxID=1737 RepID=A0ABN1M3E9_9FIRM
MTYLSTIAKPIPRDPPVTMATLFFSFIKLIPFKFSLYVNYKTITMDLQTREDKTKLKNLI